MNAPARKFEDSDAVRSHVPLLVGMGGPSGSGKTFSALRVATGIQSVSGGDIYFIDTEARRALHYADMFKFRHLEFKAPFGSLDYLAAIQHCVGKGAGVIIIDSMSHEHEGPGGLLSLHEQELDRLAGDDFGKRERVKMLAWQKPKQNRRRLINEVLQMNANFIFCFRAKETAKPIKNAQGKIEIVPLGYMPITGEEWPFEMTVNCLLLPHSNGVPTWQSDNVGERSMMKLPEQFKGIFKESKPLSEDIGKQLAEWARGGVKPAAEPKQKAPAVEQPQSEGESIQERAREAARGGSDVFEVFWKSLLPGQRAEVMLLKDELTQLRQQADEEQRQRGGQLV